MPAARAASAVSADDGERPQPLARVEIAMLGDVARDPVLYERVRSLFSAETAVVRREDRTLDQRAVLRPQRADTVYVWIRVTQRNARVYLATSESDGRARYLFRELQLDSGLDEVGSETLAEVAHSAARALWLHEQQSSREALVQALEREAETQRASSAMVAPSPVNALPVSTTRDTAGSVPRAAASRTTPSAYHLGLGASGMTHSSGSEGWLQEVGAFLSFEYRGRLALRVAARYLLPTDFGLPPARVHLTGGTGELRAGWLSNDATRMRVRIEAGLGLLFGRAQATIVDDQPQAHALGAQSFERPYALTAAGFEWPLGPAWFAVAADLRIPLRTTSYEVSGQNGASTSCALCPGGNLEIGIGFDPVRR